MGGIPRLPALKSVTRPAQAPACERAPSVPDLIIAATAELAELTVLHCDKDFDLIAAVTGQSVERIATP